MNRDMVLIGIVCVLAIVIGAWLFLAGGTAQAPTVDDTTPRIIAQGQFSGLVTERKNFRIESSDELLELWRMVYASDGPALPPVDFERYEVLAIFDGTHSSGGYDIEMVSVEDEPGATRHVTILHSAPGESCMTTQAITSPFKVIVLSKSALPITRTDITETVPCE